MRNQQLVAEANRLAALAAAVGGERKLGLRRHPAQALKPCRVCRIQSKRHQSGARGHKAQAELPCDRIAQAGRAELRNRKPTRGDDHSPARNRFLLVRAPGAAAQPQREPILLARDRDDPGIEAKLRARRFRQQHFHQLPCGAVAEQLPGRLGVVADAVSLHQRDKLPRRVAGQRRFGEVRVL